MEFGKLIASGPFRFGGAGAVSPPVLQRAITGAAAVWSPGTWSGLAGGEVFASIVIDGEERPGTDVPAEVGLDVQIVERAVVENVVTKQVSNVMRSRIAQAPVVSAAPVITAAVAGDLPEFSDGLAVPGQVQGRIWYLDGSEFAYDAPPVLPDSAIGQVLGLRVIWEHDGLIALSDAVAVTVAGLDPGAASYLVMGGDTLMLGADALVMS